MILLPTGIKKRLRAGIRLSVESSPKGNVIRV